MKATCRPTAMVNVEINGEPTKPGVDPWGTARMYLDECRLDALQCQGRVSDVQWRAGILFRAQWLKAHPSTSYAGRYKPREPGSGGQSGPDAARVHQLDAEVAIRRALDGVGDHAAMAVQAVVGLDESGKGRMHHLRTGLDHLARHYRVETDFKRREGL